MTQMMGRQGKHESHEAPMKDVERVGEALRLGTTIFWFKPSDFLGWVLFTKPLIGTIPTLAAKKATPIMIWDMEAVVKKMAMVGKNDSSAMDVSRELRAKVVGFM